MIVVLGVIGALCLLSDQVTHLGHILTSDLNDKQDIIQVIKDMNRKANSILCTFSSADPFVKCYPVKCYCLSLYGCTLWSLPTSSVKIIEVSLNKILRKVWNLPRNSHTGILHCVAQVHTISISCISVSSLYILMHCHLHFLLGLSFLILHNYYTLSLDITMFMVISTSEYFLRMILIVPPLLEIFVVFMVFILLVKMLSGLSLVISFLFVTS